jgi:ribulose-phosphate 3-epimerase
MKCKLFPSLLSVSYFEHKAIIRNLEALSSVAGLHIDVMDDHFVDNMGFSPRMIADIAAITKKTLSVHLMVDNPGNWTARLCETLKPGDIVTIHQEVLQNESSFLKFAQQFRSCKLQLGLALNPDTALAAATPYFPYIDHLLIMTVTPGFGGQDFLDTMLDKLQEAVKYTRIQERQIRVGVDGGITVDRYQQLEQIGVVDFAVGSGIFAQEKSYQDMLLLFTKKKGAS